MPRAAGAPPNHCRLWHRIASSDALWCPVIAELFQISVARFQKKYPLNSRPFGELSLMDIYTLAAWQPRVDPASPGKAQPNQKKLSSFRLAWFKACPFHPRRHSAISLPNMLRLTKCYGLCRSAFLSMAGRKKIGPLSWSPEACLEHRHARCGPGFDRLVTWTLRAYIALFSLFSFVCIYVIYIAEAVDCPSLLSPSKPLIAFLPLGVAIALLADRGRESATSLFVVLMIGILTATALTAGSLLLFEVPMYRLLLIPLGSVVSLVCFGERPYTFGSVLESFKLGYLIGMAAFLWRITIPSSLCVLAFLRTSFHSRNLAAAGFTPFAPVSVAAVAAAPATCADISALPSLRPKVA